MKGAIAVGAGRVVGVDYGTRRVGIAVSDALQVAAHPHKVVDASGAAAEIALIVREEAAVCVVVGVPTSLDGRERTPAEGARRLAADLRKIVSVPVVFADERFTSKIAERAMIEGDVRRGERRRRIDKVAAAVMLQSVLDRPGGVESLDDGHTESADN